MPYLIVPSSFAPKCHKYAQGTEPKNVHSVSYCKCNFNCEFCFFKYYKDTNQYQDFTPDSFADMVRELLPRGEMFKFTGGEPTLNSELKRDLAIVKQLGGKCFLDTNGSSPAIVADLLNAHLVDLFGISLKGLSEEETIKRSGVKNSKLCWENVLRSIQLVSDDKDAEIIVTYVCYEDFELDNLISFANILSPYTNVYLKINNFQPNLDHPTPELQPKDPNSLTNLIKTFVLNNPIWHGRVTLINGPKAVEDLNEVVLA